MFELVMEVTYGDVGEATSNGLLNSVINIYQFLFILAVTPLLDWKTEQGVFLTMIILLAIAFFGLVISIFSQIDFKRTR
jgi:cytochrome c oxidase subunit IV